MSSVRARSARYAPSKKIQDGRIRAGGDYLLGVIARHQVSDAFDPAL